MSRSQPSRRLAVKVRGWSSDGGRLAVTVCRWQAVCVRPEVTLGDADKAPWGCALCIHTADMAGLSSLRFPPPSGTDECACCFINITLSFGLEDKPLSGKAYVLGFRVRRVHTPSGM